MEATLPVQNYWNPSITDNALVDNYSPTTLQGYNRVRIEGLVFENQVEGTLPLTMYYSGENKDFATVLNYNMTESGYEFVSIQGYAYPTQEAGTIPLDMWWSSTRQDYYTIGCLASLQDAQKYNYKFVGNQGYVYPGPYWNAPLNQ